MKKDFLAVSDFTSGEVADIVRQAESLKGSNARPLEGKIVRAPVRESRRSETRVSFEGRNPTAWR